MSDPIITDADREAAKAIKQEISLVNHTVEQLAAIIAEKMQTEREAIDSVLKEMTGCKWGGDTPIERLRNALCNIYTCIQCGGCGCMVRLKYAIGPGKLCHICAGKRLKDADRLADAVQRYIRGGAVSLSATLNAYRKATK
jgi:hypothetical protein